MRLLPYGERAVLIEVASIDEVLATYAAVREASLIGVEDVVPAAQTVLVSFTEPAALQAGLPELRSLQPSETSRVTGELVTIPVTYDGADLADVAESTGLSVEQVAHVHSQTEYTVAFHGFSPGFAYLVGLDERLRVPRRPTPRASVPAGSVGITAGFTAVYPRASPGGWQLLGHTSLAMWNDVRSEPATLRPGMRVRFTPL